METRIAVCKTLLSEKACVLPALKFPPMLDYQSCLAPHDQAVPYVRGHWLRRREVAPLLLAKRSRLWLDVYSSAAAGSCPWNACYYRRQRHSYRRDSGWSDCLACWHAFLCEYSRRTSASSSSNGR